MKKLFDSSQFMLIGALVASASGCGKIPGPYRGTYVDSATGVQVALDSGKGSIKTADGRMIETDAKDLEFDKLLKGEPGIYVSMNPSEKKLIEVYWVEPKILTRQEAGGLVWFESEVLFTRMNSEEKNDVAGFNIFHCHAGTVMLDIPTQLWEIGCPSGSATITYDLKRIKQ